ncbi:MAG TPA: 30S ribosome-binding factor RbfA [Lentimicrobium sp.]|nr:30S ribosome-binding factor RbfA [Lentimicrobium sp.]
MESKRQQKISRLIQKDLGEILRIFGGQFHGGYMITVTKVNVSPDLSIAKVYLSLFGPADKEMVFRTVKQHTKDIRHQLGVRVKGQLRVIPELDFHIDDSLDYIENIDKLLKS